MSFKPDFIIVGAQKGGTTSLAYHLDKHPDIYVDPAEVHFFENPHFFDDNNEIKNPNQYQSFFKRTKKKIKGDKTPCYMYLRPAIHRIHKYAPNTKLIILLREPIQRCFSEYNMILQKYKFRGSLMDLIRKDHTIPLDQIKTNGSYLLQRGFYIDQIEYILSLFPKENVYIEISEELKDNREKFNEIVRFIGAEPDETLVLRSDIHKRDYKQPLTKEEFNYLHAIFKPYNERLYAFLGRRIPSWEDSYKKYL